MTNAAAANEVQYTHRITYKGHEAFCTVETYQETADALVSAHGPGAIPQVEKLEAQAVVPAPKRDAEAGEISLSGKLCAESDQALAEESGFAPAPPVYAIGTRVVSVGVENAKEMQVEHDAKPSARAIAASLVAAVRAEDRRDLDKVPVSDLLLTTSGKLVLPGEDGPGTGEKLILNRRAFGSLFTRFPAAAGIRYLNSCPPELRAKNFNAWSTILREQEARERPQRQETVLRTRQGSKGREIFASVSPSYSAFDADKIGEALRFAFPEDAKGSMHYDGQRVRLEGLWRTDVAAEEFVAGEIFKAGVIIRSDDSGGGSIRVQSVIWRNLCLNLIILDKAIGVDIKIRHSGSVQALARKFQDAFRKSLHSVEGFRRAWGSAIEERDEKLVERVQGTTSENLGSLPVSAVLPGLFNGILERELVPVRGRRTEIVPKLMQLHSEDEAAAAYGVSRASVINAFTRYAHTVETSPFAADDIRESAGKLLSARAGRAPTPLPYVPFAVSC